MDLPKKLLKVIHIDEPELSFGHGQTCDHPKDGLYPLWAAQWPDAHP